MGGEDQQPKQTVLVPDEPTHHVNDGHIHWGSPMMIGLYSTVVIAVVGPVVVLWAKKKFRTNGKDSK